MSRVELDTRTTAGRRRVREGRKRVARRAEEVGQSWADQGALPADAGVSVAKYSLGVEALRIAINTPGFRLADVPPRLREWLSDPVTGEPTSDARLMSIVIQECLPTVEELFPDGLSIEEFSEQKECFK